MKVLIVGDDNFTLTPCILDNPEQWTTKISAKPPSIPNGDRSSTGEQQQQNNSSTLPEQRPGEEKNKLWTVEVASCLSEDKIPFEYKSNHDKLKNRGISIHYSVNPALLRQYFTNFNPDDPDTESRPGPPFDVVLFVLPGLQYEGAPRFIDRKSDLFKLRLHLYFFALSKSSTVITRKNGAVMFLWLDQSSPALVNKDLPFPLVDIHKLGPFCKLYRSEMEDFRLNLSWGDYKTRWKPILHNVEVLHFPDYLEDLKVYVFRNAPYIPTEEETLKQQNSEEYNLLRIPQSICQWNRSILTHVNELFHFNMRTCVPGEMLQVSKLSVKYDPRITGWRNSGHPPLPQQPPAQQPQPQQPAMPVPTLMPQRTDPRLQKMVINPASLATASWGAAVGYLNGDPSQVNPYAMAMTHPDNLPPFVPNEVVMPFVAPSGTDISQNHAAPATAAYPAYETGLLSRLPAIPQVWPGQNHVTMPFDGYSQNPSGSDGVGPYGSAQPPLDPSTTPFVNDFTEPLPSSGMMPSNYGGGGADSSESQIGGRDRSGNQFSHRRQYEDFHHNGVSSNSTTRGFPSSWADSGSAGGPSLQSAGSNNHLSSQYGDYGGYGSDPITSSAIEGRRGPSIEGGTSARGDDPSTSQTGSSTRYGSSSFHDGSDEPPGSVAPSRSNYHDEPYGDYYGGSRRNRKERRRSHDSYDGSRQSYRDEVYAPQRHKYRGGSSSRRESGRHDDLPSSGRDRPGYGGVSDGSNNHRKNRPYR